MKSSVYIATSLDGFIAKLDLDGNLIWNTFLGSGEELGDYGNGIVSSSNGNIYIISGMGEISCLNASDGELIWSVDTCNKFEGAYGA